jgi:ribose/xylose/arabinose/galactoside ABC-type transport system permease subunit
MDPVVIAETGERASKRSSTISAGALLRHVLKSREIGIFTALVVTILVFSLLDRAFLSGYNLINIVLQSSVTAILAIASTFVIITAGIDLSVGSTLAVAAVSSGLLLVNGAPFPVVFGSTLGIGLVAGLINGLLTTLTGITPFVVTLGTMSIFSGLALILAGGQTVYGVPHAFNEALAGSIGPIPIPVVIAVVVMVASAFVLRQTKLGEYIIAIGGNREVARLAGINVVAYTTAAYAIAGMLAALAGMVTVARLGAADPILGKDLLLPCIAAAVMGGASLMGGEGSMVGALIGAVLIATLQAGLTFLNVQAFYQEVAVGFVIILALLFNRLQRRQS